MKEIGGYIELDTYHLPMLHEGAIALNCGRNALACLIRAREIKKLWVPKLICDSVTGVCEREGIPYSFYNIGMDFRPVQDVILGKGEWFYFVNYYSQFDNDQINEYVKRYKNIIIDNAQSYFQMPIPGVDTIYTCRKYFGVPDGAFLYTDAIIKEDYPQDESFRRMSFILGRFEHPASEFYREYVDNNASFSTEPIKGMSKLTRNLLRAIDYVYIQRIRQENYSYLSKALNDINKLRLNDNGTFMYPLYIENGKSIRKKLLDKKIYIPTLWPSVFEWCDESETEYQLVEKVLPLPIDQRYKQTDMEYIVQSII